MVQVMLGDQVEGEPLPLRPKVEVPLVLRPAGGGEVLAEAVGIAPFLHRKPRRLPEAGHGFLRDPRRALRQPDHAAGPGPLQAQHRRGRLPVLPRHAEIMVGPAPIVVGGPGSGREQEQDLRRPRPRRRAAPRRSGAARSAPRPGAGRWRPRGRSPKSCPPGSATYAAPATRSRRDRRAPAWANAGPAGPRPHAPSPGAARRGRSPAARTRRWWRNGTAPRRPDRRRWRRCRCRRQERPDRPAAPRIASRSTSARRHGPCGCVGAGWRGDPSRAGRNRTCGPLRLGLRPAAEAPRRLFRLWRRPRPRRGPGEGASGRRPCPASGRRDRRTSRSACNAPRAERPDRAPQPTRRPRKDHEASSSRATSATPLASSR